MLRTISLALLLAFATTFVSPSLATADDAAAKKEGAAAEGADPKPNPAPTPMPGAAPMPTPGGSPSLGEPPHAALLKDAKTIPGVITLYQKGNNLYAELSPAEYGQEFMVLISISRGISQGPLLGGMSWGFGDDWIWEFRKIDDKVHIVRKNVRFRATQGSPEHSAVHNAYTDSVLFSLPATIKGPKGGDLVDLTPVFMSDLPQISSVLPGFQFASNRSVFDGVKGFKDNVEINVSATYSSAGTTDIVTVPDSRGATIGVHYSISKLVNTGYQPRLADDRVGYFLTVVKDFSRKDEKDRFVRYINRWNLEKADASAKLSPPKKPIIFWIEKTVPFQYRKPIYDGISEWNKAYEKAGFVNAIEVRQQPDDATWDPEDVNYNTFRWITASAGFAMGPSRVNPRTGQILDADIIFDADFLQGWKHEYETFTPKAIAEMCGGPLNPAEYEADRRALSLLAGGRGCQLNHGMAQQLAFGSLAISAMAEGQNTPEMQEKLITQGLKEVVMHEVGHTLGLRHNFKASKLYSLKDLNDANKTKETGLVASVMDYSPTNIVPKGWQQGDFYTQTLGPYDLWAIQYGYTVIPGGGPAETAELKKIATRSGEPGLAFATDEESRAIDPDPDTNRFDLGSDAVEYAKVRAQLVDELMPGLVDRLVKDGDSYEQARRAFNILLGTRGQAASYVARYVGGMATSRSHKGDKDAKPPFRAVEAARQRDALVWLEQQVLSDKPFSFPPEIYNQLASSKWLHWGQEPSTRPDFPVHDSVLMWQNRILAQLLAPSTLERMHDAELKTPADQDVFTTAELLDRVTKAVFTEVDSLKEGEYTDRKPAISSLRRNLQRSYLRQLSIIALGDSGSPEDCQTIAFAQLTRLENSIKQLLKGKIKFDNYTRAHLQETSARIRKVLDAKLEVNAP